MASKRSGRQTRIKVADGHHWIMQHKRKMYVSAYKVSRHYGGPEEGGWYYDWHTHIATYPRRVKACRLLVVQEKMREKYGHLKTSRPNSNRYSVLGGSDVVVYNEHTPGESISKERPHYE